MTIATKNGAIIVKDGKLAENCGCCGDWWCYAECCPSDGSPCNPKTLAFWLVGPGIPCVDMRPYRFTSASYCTRPWRLVERGATCNGHNNDGVITWFDWGTVGTDGKLNGLYQWSLDFDFCSDYPYLGYLYLEIGCSNPNGEDAPYDDLWPSCNQSP